MVYKLLFGSTVDPEVAVHTQKSLKGKKTRARTMIYRNNFRVMKAAKKITAVIRKAGR
jgi:hypothetical protein